MIKLWMIAALGILLMGIVTGILMFYNWNNEKVQASLLSGGLIGVATMFVAIITILKAEHLSQTFTTSVVIDTTTGYPPLIATAPLTPSLERLRQQFSLSRPTTGFDEETKIMIEPMKKSEQISTLIPQLVQYQILEIMRYQSRGFTGWGQSITPEGWVVSTDHQEPFQLSEAIEIGPEAISKNPFSNSHMQNEAWKLRPLKVPSGTKLTIEEMDDNGIRNYIIALKNPGYFEIRIISKFDGSTGAGAIPAGLITSLEERGRLQTHHLLIKMTADFDQLTSGSSQKIEFKKWAEWLFDGIEKQLSDKEM